MYHESVLGYPVTTISESVNLDPGIETSFRSVLIGTNGPASTDDVKTENKVAI